MVSSGGSETSHITTLKDAVAYPMWSRQLSVLLASKDLLKYTDGTCKFDPAATALSKAEWTVEDAHAQNYLFSTIDDSIKLHVLSATSAAEIFSRLKTIFEKDTEEQKCTLLSQFYACTWDRQKNVLENTCKVRNLSFRLNSLNEAITDTMVITKILSILPPELVHYRSSWGSVGKEEKTVDNLVSRLETEETNLLKASGSSSIPSTSSAPNNVCYQTEAKGFRASVVCYKCNRQGHVARFCRSTTVLPPPNVKPPYKGKQPSHNRSNKPICGFCKNVKHWHLEKDCLFNKARGNSGLKRPPTEQPRYPGPKRQKFNPHKADKPVEKPAPNNVSTDCSMQADFDISNTHRCSSSLSSQQTPINGGDNMSIQTLDEEETINEFEGCVDSACTAHMSNDRSLLTDFSHQHANILVAKKNQTMSSVGKGSIVTEKYVFNNTLVVPELRRNLISVNALTEDNRPVVFTKRAVHVLKNNIVVPESEILMSGRKAGNGLFIINVKPIKAHSMLTDQDNQKAMLWHKKLGHLSMTGLKKLSTLCPDMKLNMTPEDMARRCTVCILAKQHKEPHNKKRERATEPLRIVHTDVCGPFRTATHDRKIYFVTFLDDATHFSTVFLMERKNEVFPLLSHFVEQAENFHGKRVYKIRCDNGGEYVNNECISWCRQKGIMLDTTIPRCPQLNGKSERLNRTILERARAILFASHLHQDMWGEAVLTAVHTINRCHSDSVDAIPAELWYGSKPDLSRLQVFGSEVFAKVLSPVGKLDPRSVRCVFVGYGSNGYRLWNPQTRKIFMSRDVVFTGQIATQPGQTVVAVNDLIQEAPADHHNPEDEEVNTNEKDKVLEQPSEESENTGNIQTQHLDSPTNEMEFEPVFPDLSSEDTLSQSDVLVPTEDQAGVPTPEASGRSLRPRRNIQMPKKFEDYEVYYTKKKRSYEEYEAYFIEEDKSFLTSLMQSSVEAMLTYQDCIRDKQWKKAIDEEKRSLYENQVWSLVDRDQAKGKDIVSSRWIFKIKDDGVHKARLVARGFQQSSSSFDFKDIYSPVVDTSTLRMLFALAAQNKCDIVTFDVKTAFLYGTLDKDVYMEVPEGFNSKNKICLLKKALYGLNQAPLRWYKRLSAFLHKEGLTNLKSDKCIFRNNDKTLYLAIHVDDGIVLSKDPIKIGNLLAKLCSEFKVKVNHKPSSYVGLEFQKVPTGILVHQTKYALSVLSKYNMENCSPASIPMEQMTTAQKEATSVSSTSKFPYRQAVGSLLYLACKTRPDLSFAVNTASRAVDNPSDEDVGRLKQIFKYLKGSVNTGLFYSSTNTCQNSILQTYSDADFASSGPQGQMKSTTGYTILYAGGPVTWCSRRQSTVATSTAESEYISAAECCKELQFLSTLLTELTDIKPQAIFHVDNQGAICLIKSGKMNWGSKHFNVKYYFISEKCDEGLFTLIHCPSSEQLADILTKPLKTVKFEKFKSILCHEVASDECYVSVMY